MQDDFASLYAYNRWADRLILDACRKLTAEQYGSEPVPGWTSVRSSIVHIAVVTEGWLRGVAGETAFQNVPTEENCRPWTMLSGCLMGRTGSSSPPTFADAGDPVHPPDLQRPRSYRCAAAVGRAPAHRQPLHLSPRPGRGQAQAHGRRAAHDRLYQVGHGTDAGARLNQAAGQDRSLRPR